MNTKLILVASVMAALFGCQPQAPEQKTPAPVAATPAAIPTAPTVTPAPATEKQAAPAEQPAQAVAKEKPVTELKHEKAVPPKVAKKAAKEDAPSPVTKPVVAPLPAAPVPAASPAPAPAAAPPATVTPAPAAAPAATATPAPAPATTRTEGASSKETVTTVTDATFDSAVLQASRPVLVFFWAEWCAPCRAAAPIVDGIAETYAGRLSVAKLSIVGSPLTPKKFDLTAVPTYMLFKNGKPVGSIKGKQTEAELKAFIDGNL